MDNVQEEAEEVRIKKVGVLSVANIAGLVNVFIGLILGIIVALFSSLLNLGTALGSFGLGNFAKGWLAVIILPIAYGAMGFIGGAIGALLYNLAAKITKGIKIYS